MKEKNSLQDFFTNPPIGFLIVIIIVAIGSIIGTTLIMTKANSLTILGYALLAVMIVSVSYSIYGIVKIYPRIKEKTLQLAQRNKFWNRLFTEYGFSTIMSMIFSLLINIAFVVYNGSIGIVIQSIWFGALAAYYLILTFLRGGLLLYHTRRRKLIKDGQLETQIFLRDTKAYGITGGILILLPIALSFAILQMVRANDTFKHEGITIYVYAIYAFYKIINAIINLIKAKKTKAMTIRAAKNINLADAMMSILALQTAMFHEFGGIGSENTTAIANAATGGVVCALTAIIGVLMAINASIIVSRTRNSANN